MIQEFFGTKDGEIATVERLQRFIVIRHTGESWPTFARDKDEARKACEDAGHSDVWKVLAYPQWI